MKKQFIKVAFHNYVFHGDEVACAAIIECLYGKPEKSIRISARNDDALQQAVCDGYTLVDVGGGQFDHHSPEARKNCYENKVIKSAFGLVLEQAVRDGKLTEFEEYYILQHGGYALQAADNGQDFEGVESPFEYVKWLNNSDPSDENAQMKMFVIAVETAVHVFSSMLESARCSLPDHETFLEAASRMEDGIVDLPCYIPNAVEEAQNWNSRFPDKTIRFFTFLGSDGAYRIQAVNKVGSFALEHELPFKGLRNEALCQAAQITDGIFVHPNGFIAATETLESCHKLGMLLAN